MQRMFIIALAAVITLAAALGVILLYSVWPYIDLIGKVATGTIIVGLVCIALLMVSFTITRIGTWSIRRHVIAIGEVVVFHHSNGEFTHLSAQHEMAKIAPPVQFVDSDEDSTASTDEVVLELWRRGVTLRNIEKVTGRKYHEIQKITSAAKRQS